MGKLKTQNTSNPAEDLKITLVCTIKNEAPYFLEWLAYHRLIGFNNFVIFENDSSDGTQKLLRQLDLAGLITHVDNSTVSEDLPEDPQRRAYARAQKMESVKKSDWLMVIDGDEFLKVNCGDGTVNALLAEAPIDSHAILIQWKIFGSSGIEAFDDSLQIEQFQKSADEDKNYSHHFLAVKTIFRPKGVKRLGVHRPVFTKTIGTEDNPVLLVNGSGEDVTDYFLRGNWCNTYDNRGSKLAQVNHYMIRSHEFFLLKRWRGTANSFDASRIDFSYFDQFNVNDKIDDGMAIWVEKVKSEINKIYKMAPKVENIVKASRLFAREKIITLKDELRSSDQQKYKRLFPIESNLTLKEQSGGAGSQSKISAAEDSTALTAPGWLQEFNNERHHTGFFNYFGNAGAHYVERSSTDLVITFDNLSSVREGKVIRDSWGFGFIKKNNWSHLGVFSYEENWFRDRKLISFLEDFASSKDVDRFKRITLLGTSMGGYAATAFSSMFPGCTVVAYSPQSTLDSKLVPWETRFKSGRKADWSGKFSDGAVESQLAEKVWIIIDPMQPLDRQHAARFSAPNVSVLHARHAEHKTALILRRAEILSEITKKAIDKSLTPQEYYKIYRRSRNLQWYLNAVVQKAMTGKSIRRLEAIEEYLTRTERPGLARTVRKEIEKRQ